MNMLNTTTLLIVGLSARRPSFSGDTLLSCFRRAMGSRMDARPLAAGMTEILRWRNVLPLGVKTLLLRRSAGGIYHPCMPDLRHTFRQRASINPRSHGATEARQQC